MYEYLKGSIEDISPDKVVLGVNGIGYDINISHSTFEGLKDKKEAKIFVWLHVKEDDMTLYGFSEKNERTLFLLLNTVNGISAASSRAILSQLSPSNLISAILNSDVVTIKSLKGVGEKKAQKIVIELKDKVAKLDFSDMLPGTLQSPNRGEALAALLALGYNRPVASKAVEKVISENGSDLSVEDIIKQALKLV